MKILLIDDDVFLRDMYATKFKERGDSVETAQNGSEGLSLVEKENFDVIIMDMVMPGMSGVELLTLLQNNEHAKGTKCIVLSNQGEESDISEAKKHGAIGYIVKAESIPSEVVEKVHALIS